MGNWEEKYESVCYQFEEYGFFKKGERYLNYKGIDLSSWYRRQVTALNKGELSEDRAEKIRELMEIKEEFRQGHDITSWEEGIQYLKEYLKTNQDGNIKYYYLTEDRVRLGKWLNEVQEKIRKRGLLYSQIRQLQDLSIPNSYCRGFDLKNREENWFNYYELSKAYLIDKYSYDLSDKGRIEEERVINRWINEQKKRENLDSKRAELFAPLLELKKELRILTEKHKVSTDARIKEIFENYTEGIMRVEIHGMIADEKTQRLVRTMGEADYYECEMCLSALLTKDLIIDYVKTNQKDLIIHAKKAIIDKCWKKQYISLKNLKLDKVRCGTESKILSMIFSVHLKI